MREDVCNKENEEFHLSWNVATLSYVCRNLQSIWPYPKKTYLSLPVLFRLKASRPGDQANVPLTAPMRTVLLPSQARSLT